MKYRPLFIPFLIISGTAIHAGILEKYQLPPKLTPSICYYPANGKTAVFYAVPGGTNVNILLEAGKTRPIDCSGCYSFHEGPIDDYNRASGYFIYAEEGRKFLELAGGRHGPYDGVNPPRFTRDYKGYSFLCSLKGKEYLNVSGMDCGPYDKIVDSKTAPDNPDAFMILFTSNCQKYVNANGTITGPYTDCHIYLSPDGKNPCIVYKKNGDFIGTCALAAGKTFGPYKDIPSILFSKSGSFYYFPYTARKDERDYNINGREYPCSDKRRWMNFYCSKTGGRYALEYSEEGGNYFLTENGGVIGPYFMAYAPVFSADDRHLAFKYHQEKDYYEDGTIKNYLYIDGKVKGPFQAIYSTGFSPDGGKFVYLEKHDGNFHFHIDDMTYGPCRIFGSSGDDFFFSPDSKHAAFRFLALKNGQVQDSDSIWLDKRVTGPWGNILRPHFSAHNNYFLFQYNASNEAYTHWMNLADTNSSGSYKGEIFFSSDESRMAFNYKLNGADYIYSGGDQFGPFPGPYSFGFDGQNRLIAAWYDPRTGILTVEEKQKSDVAPALGLKLDCKKISELSYQLTLKVVNAGNGPAKDIRLNIRKEEGIPEISYTEPDPFTLGPGESREIVVTLAVNPDILGSEKAVYKAWFAMSGSSIVSDTETFIISVEQ